MKIERNHNGNQKSHRMRISRIMGIILWAFIVCRVGKIESENFILYKQGQASQAFVYRRTSKGRRGVSLYEFQISGIRYTGHDTDSAVGDSIEIVYLPKNPKINRNAEVLDKDWCIWLYRKIFE